jgi:hypothetical protein
MTPTEALVQVAKDLHHLANTLELLVKVPDAEYIPTDDDIDVPTVDETPVVKDHGITLEQIRTILQQKSRSGLRNEVNNLILAFGVKQLSDVPYEKYPELLLAAEEM